MTAIFAKCLRIVGFVDILLISSWNDHCHAAAQMLHASMYILWNLEHFGIRTGCVQSDIDSDVKVLPHPEIKISLMDKLLLQRTFIFLLLVIPIDCDIGETQQEEILYEPVIVQSTFKDLSCMRKPS